MIYDALLAKYQIISEQVSRERLAVILRELEKVLTSGTPGAIAEFGCYIGTTSLFIRRLLDELGKSADHPFHVYDSFDGLPEKSDADRSPAGIDFKAGEIKASKKQFLEEFRHANLLPPIIHKAWFDQLSNADVPKPIAFAFLDGDFYESILTSLNLVWPRLSEHAVITIDDYQREALPGVERAVQLFLAGKKFKHLHAEHNIAILEI